MTSEPDSSKVSNMQSLHRAMAILKIVVTSPRGLSLTSISKGLGLSLSTTHRIAGALVEDMILSYRENEKIYVPGSEMYRLGREVSRFFSAVQVARPFMEELAETTGDTVFLLVREGDEICCVERIVGSYPIKAMTLDVGVRRPLGVGGSAVALFAVLPDDEIERIIRDNRQQREKVSPSTSDEKLREYLAHFRAEGFGMTYGTVVPGMGAVSVCIYDSLGHPIAAISVSALKERLEGERLKWVVQQMRETAQSISKQL